jgi:hypothetical protein
MWCTELKYEGWQLGPILNWQVWVFRLSAALFSRVNEMRRDFVATVLPLVPTYIVIARINAGLAIGRHKSYQWQRLKSDTTFINEQSFPTPRSIVPPRSLFSVHLRTLPMAHKLLNNPVEFVNCGLAACVSVQVGSFFP